jgi:hypothetical protein
MTTQMAGPAAGGGCGCGGTGSSPGAGVTGCADTGAAGLERTRYFARQLVGADDLTQDQLYFREKARRHNRMLHGWGIVCGARVRAGTAPCEVVVEAGYILGPYGDEIQIDADVVVDVCSEDLSGNVLSLCGPVDPWCSDVRVDRPSGQPVYLAIAYAECLSRPVRAVSQACGCDDGACEYSRTRDSFRLVVLDALPATYSAAMRAPSVTPAVSCPPAPEGEPCGCPQCAACPSLPWVILADLTVDGGAVTGIDCDSHRRYVASFRDFFYLCGDGQKRQRPDVREKLARVLRPEAIRAFEESAGLATPPVGQWTGDRLLVSGIARNSVLARRLKELTIGDIAATGHDAFVEAMVSALPASRRSAVARQAAEVWAQAADAILTLSPR